MDTTFPPRTPTVRATTLAPVPEDIERDSIAFYRLLDEIMQMQIRTRDRLWRHFGKRRYLKKQNRKEAVALGNDISINFPHLLAAFTAVSGRLKAAGYNYVFLDLIGEDGSKTFVHAWVNEINELLPHNNMIKYTTFGLD